MPKIQAMKPNPVEGVAEESENEANNNTLPEGDAEEPSTSKSKETIPSDEASEIRMISKPQEDKPSTSKTEAEIERCCICLDDLKNAGKPNTCSHKFCFSCIKQWCENHSSCPLCKADFSVIQYNIRSGGRCDKYPVLSPYYERALIAYNYKYAARWIINQGTDEEKRLEQEFAVYQLWALTDCDPDLLIRLGYPDLAVPRREIGFRRCVYRRRLWSIPPPPSLLRPSTPKHFFEKPEDLERVVQWVKRELSSLIEDNSVYNQALESITNWLKTYRLSDRWFYVRAYQYLGTFTDHFLHELKCFATSSIDDIETYDNTVQYLMRKHKRRLFADRPAQVNQLFNLPSWDRESGFELVYVHEGQQMIANVAVDSDTVEEAETVIDESG